MLEAGEDPLFILRRMLIFASEDIGNADPQALQVATSAMQSFQSVGLPEGVLPMTQAVSYLATAPKSNAVIMAYGRARKDVREHPNLKVPRHLVNAPTPMMKELGYGRGYRYPHNFEGHYVRQDYRPGVVQGRVYYEPSEEGFEQEIRRRMEKWDDADSD
jgi:putative ATPase